MQADPRSPERGQYSFLQDIVKRVAYETISRRERKAKHLATAQYLASAWSAEEDEIVEVVASALPRRLPRRPGGSGRRRTEVEGVRDAVRAAERAASLGANAEAQRAFERAGELTGDTLAQAELHERAGVMAAIGARQDDAAANFQRAIDLFESAAASHPAARVSARVAEISWERGRIEQGLESMDRAFAVLSEEEPDADLAALAAQIGRFMFFAGQSDVALERLDRALEIAELLFLPETLSEALNTKGIILTTRGRKTEGIALVGKALDIALEHDKRSAALRAYYNLADLSGQMDRAHESAELTRDGLALARSVGNRYWEWSFLGFAYPAFVLGDSDDVVAREEGLPDEDWVQARIAFATLLTSIVPVHIHRGNLEDAKRSARLFAELEGSADLQEQSQVHCAEAALLLAEGNYAEALRSAEASLATRNAIGISFEAVRESFVVAVEAALALDDVQRAEQLLSVVDTLPPGGSPRFLQAQSARFTARLVARREDPRGGRAPVRARGPHAPRACPSVPTRSDAAGTGRVASDAGSRRRGPAATRRGTLDLRAS